MRKCSKAGCEHRATRYHSYCKPCMNAYRSHWRRNPPIRRNQKHNPEAKLIVQSLLLDTPCLEKATDNPRALAQAVRYHAKRTGIIVQTMRGEGTLRCVWAVRA